MAGMDSQAYHTVSSESPYACKCIIDIEQSHFNFFFSISFIHNHVDVDRAFLRFTRGANQFNEKSE